MRHCTTTIRASIGALTFASFLFCWVIPASLYAEGDSNPSPIASLLATADVTVGKQLANKCTACHTFEKGGAKRYGPNLWNIVGAPHARDPDYSYSASLKAMHDRQWTDEELNKYLFNPHSHTPGTKMTFGGMKDAQERANLIAWLHTLSDSPLPQSGQ